MSFKLRDIVSGFRYTVLLGVCLALLCGCNDAGKSIEADADIENRSGVTVFSSKTIQDSLNVFMNAVDSSVCDVFSIWIEKDGADTLLWFYAFEGVYPEPEWKEHVFKPLGARVTAEGEIIAVAYIGLESSSLIVDENLYSLDMYERNSFSSVSRFGERSVPDYVLPSLRVYKYHTPDSIELVSIYKSDYENVMEKREKAVELYRLGVQYSKEGDKVKAAEYFMQSAELGYAFAQHDLACCYDWGEGVEQDSEKAAQWYEIAAKQGDAMAQFSIGNCYEIGQGVKQNYWLAEHWYRKSAEQGYAPAQYSLGRCYTYGLGVEQSFKMAAKWYRAAAEQGEELAQLYLGICYERGDGVEQDYIEAFNWYIKAAEQGNIQAVNNLGAYYENGFGVEKDYSKAIYYYRIAAEHGYAVAQCNLGACYQYGRGTEIDYANAAEWYRKSAEQGDEYAIELLEKLENKL